VKTRHENIGGPGQVINDFGPHPDDIGGSGIRKKVFIALACDRAAITGNAFFLVLVKIIDAHDLLPSASIFDRRSGLPEPRLFLYKYQIHRKSKIEYVDRKWGPLDFPLEFAYIA
jgi:hypothetical protein